MGTCWSESGGHYFRREDGVWVCQICGEVSQMKTRPRPAAPAGPGTPLLTGTPGMERRDGATVDLAEYDMNPEYRVMIDARRAAAAGPGTTGGDHA